MRGIKLGIFGISLGLMGLSFASNNFLAICMAVVGALIALIGFFIGE